MMAHRQRPWQGAMLTGVGVLVVILLVVIPVVMTPGSNFGGSDGAAAFAIQQIAPQYDSTWARNWWRPPGTETESMLFALQAAAGGLLIGYTFGYLRGRRTPTTPPPGQPGSDENR